MAYAECFCRRCRPTVAPVVCSRCGEEVRIGERGGQRDWWHRESVDHPAAFGHLLTEADVAATERALDEERLKDDGTTYTTRQFDYDRMKKSVRDALEDGDEDYEPEEIPAPEVLATAIEKLDPRLPGGAKSVWNLAEKNGWRIYRATYSRGPRVHSTQQRVLSISDYVVLGIILDEQGLVGVGSWRDGKFEYAYVGKIHSNRLDVQKVDSKTWKSLIKGETP